MVLPVIINIAVRSAANYVAKGLRYQEALLNKGYSRPFLPRNFNRHALKGMKHGLAGGQAAGIFLYGDEITEFSATPIPKKPRFETNRFKKTRSGYATRFGYRRSRKCYPNKYSR